MTIGRRVALLLERLTRLRSPLAAPSRVTNVRAAYLAVALLDLATIGCGSVTYPPPPELPTTFTNAGRIQAMLSVHAHFLWPNKRFPTGLRPVSLTEAAQYLADDTDSGRNRPAWSRRRRAIAEIAAVGLDRPEFTEALQILGISPDGIRAKLHEHKALKTLTTAQLVALIADLPEVKGTGDDCFANWSKLLVTVAPPNAPHASYTAKIRVPRPAKDVAKAIDPQSWDHCSKFFCFPERAYLAHLDANKKPVADPRLPPWTEYKGRTLFEKFTCPLQDCHDTTFENLLNVSAYTLNTGFPIRYQVTYSMHTYLDGYANGWPDKDVEILIDGGQLWAEPNTSGSGTIAYADKTILFANPILTGGVNGAFRVAQEELAREFAELACCQITTTIPTTCPP